MVSQKNAGYGITSCDRDVGLDEGDGALVMITQEGLGQGMYLCNLGTFRRWMEAGWISARAQNV